MVEGQRQHDIVARLEDTAASDDGINMAATGYHTGGGSGDVADLKRVQLKVHDQDTKVNKVWLVAT